MDRTNSAFWSTDSIADEASFQSNKHDWPASPAMVVVLRALAIAGALFSGDAAGRLAAAKDPLVSAPQIRRGDTMVRNGSGRVDSSRAKKTVLHTFTFNVRALNLRRATRKRLTAANKESQ
jgi:hypothetical protein